MTSMSITIPGELRGKQRARVTRSGHAYTPEATLNAEAWVKHCAIQQGATPLDGPISLTVAILKAVPRSWSKRDRAAALERRLLPTGKPDIDNVAKLILDSLNGIAWLDDSQVVHLTIRKAYAETSFATLHIEPAILGEV